MSESLDDSDLLVVKSVGKKSRNIIGVLPKCLLSSFPLDFCALLQNNPELTFQGLILDILFDQVPLIAIQPELLNLKDSIPRPSDLKEELVSGQSYVGVVREVSKGGQVRVMFLGGATASIKVKDLNKVDNYQGVYSPGKVIRVAVNKLGRLCTKEKVIRSCLTADQVSEDKF